MDYNTELQHQALIVTMPYLVIVLASYIGSASSIQSI